YLDVRRQKGSLDRFAILILPAKLQAAIVRQEDARLDARGKLHRLKKLVERINRPWGKSSSTAFAPSGTIEMPKMVEATPSASSKLPEQHFLPVSLTRFGAHHPRRFRGGKEVLSKPVSRLAVSLIEQGHSQ